MVCYDLRFPEWSRNREDYDLLIYVANWPHTRSLHWKTLLRARAIENQCYVAGINRVGDDGNHLTYSGDSMICAYDGSILAEHSQSEMTLNAILSKESLSVFRRKLPFLKDQNW